MLGFQETSLGLLLLARKLDQLGHGDKQYDRTHDDADDLIGCADLGLYLGAAVLQGTVEQAGQNAADRDCYRRSGRPRYPSNPNPSAAASPVASLVNPIT